jgi:hypothetical protein
VPEPCLDRGAQLVHELRAGAGSRIANGNHQVAQLLLLGAHGVALQGGVDRGQLLGHGGIEW